MDHKPSKIRWDRVERLSAREPKQIIWKPYGLPEITDPFTSALADVEVLPKWNVPEKVIITTTITGAFYSRKDNPNQPMTPEEIRDSALEAIAAGSPGVHVHVRDDKGYNTLSLERFREVMDPIRAQHPNVVTDGCLVAALDGEWEQMEGVIDAKLFDCVPVNTTAAYIGDSLFAKPAHLMIEKTEKIQRAGLKAQIALYTDADVSNADRFLIRPGLLEKPYYWIVLPALPGCSPMNSPRQMLEGLNRMVNSIYDVDDSSIILVCAAGRASTYLATAALLMGLNVRVGMEDTVWLWPHRDDLVTSNSGHFQMLKQMAELLGRRVVNTADYREMVGLKPVHAPATTA